MTTRMSTLREAAGMPPPLEKRRLVLEILRVMEMPVTKAQVAAAVADRLGLSADQRAVMAPKGDIPLVDWEVGWDLSLFKNTGFLQQPRVGMWTLTDDGRRLSFEDHRRRERERNQQRRKQRQEATATTNQDHDAALAGPEVEVDWQQELLDAMKAISPAAFEHLAAELLRTTGFDDVQVTGQSGDGGIDGIGIYRPAGLVSFRTAFQCKRYSGSVGPSAVRDFRGSFVGQADRGIFITTGSFTSMAAEEAVRAGAPTVDLIDGEDLCDLLKQHKIGVNVQLRTVEDVTVSGEYFERLEEASR